MASEQRGMRGANSGSAERRRALAERLRARRETIARDVTDDFLDRHPDWVERYGELARRRGEEDAAFHVEFLAGALVAGGRSAFEDYARWTARVLASRGIEPAFLVENLEQVREHAGRGFDEDGRALLDALIDAGTAAVEEASLSVPADDRGGAIGGADEADEVEQADGLATERSLYLQAILAGERRAALNVTLEAVRSGVPVSRVYHQVLQPAQYEVGRRWERNEISVATEHVATAITQYVMAQLYGHLEIPETVRGNAVVTGVEGELHQLGANMVADVLEAEGWNVRFLGTQLPHGDVLGAVEDHEPRLLGVSATVLFNLPAVGRLIEDARSRFGSELRIVVGGGAFRSNPEVWRELGADGFGRDLMEAVALVDRLLPADGEEDADPPEGADVGGRESASPGDG